MNNKCVAYQKPLNYILFCWFITNTSDRLTEEKNKLTKNFPNLNKATSFHRLQYNFTPPSASVQFFLCLPVCARSPAAQCGNLLEMATLNGCCLCFIQSTAGHSDQVIHDIWDSSRRDFGSKKSRPEAPEVEKGDLMALPGLDLASGDTPTCTLGLLRSCCSPPRHCHNHLPTIFLPQPSSSCVDMLNKFPFCSSIHSSPFHPKAQCV